MKKILFLLLLIPIISQAVTPIFTCGFECGRLGASGEHWGNGTQATISTSTVRYGARSLRVNPTATTSFQQYTAAASTAVNVFRIAIYFATLPGATTEVASMYTASANAPGAYFKSSDSKIYAGTSTSNLGATGVSVTTGVWYYIDVKVDVTTNPWLVDVKVSGSACEQASGAIAGSTFSIVRLGCHNTSITADIFYDDFILSQTSGDYPFGDGHVDNFVPTADGSHNIAGANDFEFSATGTDITNATTTSYTLIDDIPMEAQFGAPTDFINGIAPPAGTDYTENIFGPAPSISTPTTAPRAVEILVATAQSATTTGDFKLDLNDNGTLNTIKSQTAVAGVTTVRWWGKQYATPPTGGPWTVSAGAGNFNNLRVRFYSADPAPDQYFVGAMIEAEFPILNNTIPGTPGDKRHTLLGVGGN